MALTLLLTARTSDVRPPALPKRAHREPASRTRDAAVPATLLQSLIASPVSTPLPAPRRGGAHMHVASTMIFDGPPPPYEQFRAHLESRLHLVPRFRQKLRFVPFNQGRPIWIDDPHLNLDYHVRHTALPSPGSEEQMRNFAARAFSQGLDRTKPMWELWLVSGLEEDRFAIVCKTHPAHRRCSGGGLTNVLYDASAEPAAADQAAMGRTARAQ